MSEIKVDKDVPLPPESRGGRRWTKYPWEQMGVGDSIFIPGRKATGFSSHVAAGKRHGMRFTRRGVEGGIRIWRTA